MDKRITKLVIGIINSLFIAQTPRNMHFEKFLYLYTALDACYALTKNLKCAPEKLSHYKRIDWMCKQFQASTPIWANPGEKHSDNAISFVRNNTLHEALFFDEPLGFASYRVDPLKDGHAHVLLQMKHLVCRLLVALLGKPDCEYVKSKITTRDIYDLDLS